MFKIFNSFISSIISIIPKPIIWLIAKRYVAGITIQQALEKASDLNNEGYETVWRGLSTVAGSWIGGGANQAAMKEVFNVGDKMFSAMVAVDVITAQIWMGILLYGVGSNAKINKSD